MKKKYVIYIYMLNIDSNNNNNENKIFNKRFMGEEKETYFAVERELRCSLAGDAGVFSDGKKKESLWAKKRKYVKK